MDATESGMVTLAREAEIELEAGTTLPWLSNRGQLNLRTRCENRPPGNDVGRNLGRKLVRASAES
jgi:hypothetical protein